MCFLIVNLFVFSLNLFGVKVCCQNNQNIISKKRFPRTFFVKFSKILFICQVLMVSLKISNIFAMVVLLSGNIKPEICSSNLDHWLCLFITRKGSKGCGVKPLSTSWIVDWWKTYKYALHNGPPCLSICHQRAVH